VSKITASACGEECQVRIPGVCNHNPETTVAAHINGGGMGTKQPDSELSYACSSCHDVIDGRTNPTGLLPETVKLYHHEGAMRTRKILIEKGLIKLEGKQ